MKTFLQSKTLLLFCALMLSINSSYAQSNNDYFLNKAKENIQNGEFVKAQNAYNIYKQNTNKTDAGVETILNKHKTQEVTPIKAFTKQIYEQLGSPADVVISDEYISIGDRAFSNCDSLRNITIPDTVTAIGEYAFGSCDNLTSITIPQTVVSIGGGVFALCDEHKLDVKIEGDNFIYENSILYDRYRANIISSIAKGSIIIPNSVASIDDYAFYCCKELQSITIPNSLTLIGRGAFLSCEGLQSITIPNSVTSIGDAAFYDCAKLTFVRLPNSLNVINDNVFRNCYSLKLINIPNTVISIGKYAFSYCCTLDTITLPVSIEAIGDGAFEGCALSDITIPNSVTSIGKEVFKDCESLSSIYISKTSSIYKILKKEYDSKIKTIK